MLHFHRWIAAIGAALFGHSPGKAPVSEIRNRQEHSPINANAAFTLKAALRFRRSALGAASMRRGFPHAKSLQDGRLRGKLVALPNAV